MIKAVSNMVFSLSVLDFYGCQIVIRKRLRRADLSGAYSSAHSGPSFFTLPTVELTGYIRIRRESNGFIRTGAIWESGSV
jgi:hypothetical protein